MVYGEYPRCEQNERTDCICMGWVGANFLLTHRGRVTHICVGKLTIIGSDNGLSPGRRQAIIWTNAGILLIGPLGTYFSEFLIAIETFSCKKMHLKISSAKWRPFCLGLNVLISSWQMQGVLLVQSVSEGESEGVIKFNGFPGDRGHQGPYRPCNRSLYIGIIIFPHIDYTQSTGHNWKKKELKQKSEGTIKLTNHWRKRLWISLHNESAIT